MTSFIRCHFCTRRLSHERAIVSNACERCGKAELSKSSNFNEMLKAETKRVIRCWQPYTPEQRANLAAARMNYTGPAGEFYYVHPGVPGRAFPKRKLAALAAMEA